jgi:hypothetical protein
MSQNKNDLEQIRQTVQLYFDGMYLSDVTQLKQAFHPAAFLMGYFEGNFAHIPLTNWLEMVEKTPAPSKNGEAYDMKIVSIDITETVAVVKVADLYLGLRFTDYLSLVNTGDSWVIVNKVFHHEPRA